MNATASLDDFQTALNNGSLKTGPAAGFSNEQLEARWVNREYASVLTTIADVSSVPGCVWVERC